MSDLIFNIEPNWTTDFVEQREFETDIFESDGGYEQRSAGRSIPNRRFTFDVSGFSSQESARLEAFIRHAQGEPCWIPYWPGARIIPNPLNIADNQININTQFAGFEQDQCAMIFRDINLYERVDIAFVNPTLLGISGPTKAWSQGKLKDRVVPLFQGYIAPDTELTYVDKEARVARLTFDITSGESTKAPDPETVAGPGFDFLDDFESYKDTLDLLRSWPVKGLFNGITFSLEKGNPFGTGQCVKVTIPPHSNFGASQFGCHAFRNFRSMANGTYTITAKIRTSWDVEDPDYNNPLIVEFGGKPSVGICGVLTPTPGCGAIVATSAAHNAWETVTMNAPVAYLFGNILTAYMTQIDGTYTDETLYVWFDDIHITGPGPAVVVSSNPVFPLLHLLTYDDDGDAHQIHREVQKFENKAGPFALFPFSDHPITSHDVLLDFDNAEDIQAFWNFHALVIGAAKTFWIPSLVQDFVLTEPIAADDLTFTFEAFGYTDIMSEDSNRQQIAFVRPDNSFLKRTIVSCVDNGDGTETATLNEELGEVFNQDENKGVCFMLFVRFDDDVGEVHWDGQAGTASFKLKEVRGAPSGSGDQSEIPL